MKISYQHKKQLLKKYNGRCAYCGNPITAGTMTIDHIFPKSKGGRRTENNMRPSCFLCNQIKANLSSYAFKKRINVLKQKNDYIGSSLRKKYPSNKISFYYEGADAEKIEVINRMEKLFADIRKSVEEKELL